MYYDILKASKVKAEVFPDYWTQLWGRKLSESMIKTLTGTLPLTFTTSETALRSWTIYGNNTPHNYSAEGTLPLTFTTHTAGNADDWAIYGNELGVGERTANKMPAPVNGVYSVNRTTVTVTDGVYHIVQTEGSGSSSVYIDLPEFEVPDSGYINYLNSMAFGNAAVVLRYNGASLSGGYALTPINRAVAIGSDYAGKKVNQIQIYTTGNDVMDFTIAPMITDSNTYTTYILYGYYVPLTVSQTGQTDKNYDIFIGDSPLTEGETVSKTSTGIDIELFEGENTVSTTMYNKPAMSIEGVDYVGVGEPTNDGWQIPLTVSDGTNMTTVNVPIEAPLTDGQSVTDTVTISTFEGENTLDTTLTNKPEMTIVYKGGISNE